MCACLIFQGTVTGFARPAATVTTQTEAAEIFRKLVRRTDGSAKVMQSQKGQERNIRRVRIPNRKHVANKLLLRCLA
jgi:hypothetical protein